MSNSRNWATMKPAIIMAGFILLALIIELLVQSNNTSRSTIPEMAIRKDQNVDQQRSAARYIKGFSQYPPPLRGITLLDLKDDVIFRLGKPTRKVSTEWIYIDKSKYSNGIESKLYVTFRNDSVVAVFYILGIDEVIFLNDKVSIWTTMDVVVRNYGQPTRVKKVEDGEVRILFYENIRCLFALRRNTVYGIGYYIDYDSASY